MKNKGFSDRLAEALELRGMRLIDLSRRTGIYKGTISNYLKGKYVPKNEKAQAIAFALDVSSDWLLFGGDDFHNMTRGEIKAALLSGSGDDLTDEETAILEAYRNADEKTKKKTRILLGVEVEA